MDIRKIALYLSGKISPEYKKYNRLEFMDLLENVFGYKYDKLEFYRRQAKEYEEEFYFLVLEFLYNKAIKDNNERIKFDKLISDLDLPNTIVDINIHSKYTRSDFENKIKEIYGENSTTDDKGDFFEEFCRDVLIYDGFCNVKIAGRGGDGGIDITADKEILIGVNTKKVISFIGQCKYKTNGNVTKDEVNSLLTPIIKDSQNMYQGILFFTNKKYMPKAKEELENTQSSRVNIKSFYLDGDELLNIVNSNNELYKKYK